MIKISVIIVTFNSIDFIRQCIDSIINHNDLSPDYIEIIIVDNSSKKQSEQMFVFIKDLYGNKIKLIRNQSNLGYGYGNNVGIDNAKGNIICIMNPDVQFIEPVFLDIHLEFQNNNNLGLLGLKQLGGLNYSYNINPEYFYPVLNTIVTRVSNKLNFFYPKYFCLSGALLFIDSHKFREIGLFDTNLFLYFEEADISKRFINNSYEIKFMKDKKYLHLIDDRRGLSHNSFKVWLFSSVYYLRKYNLNERSFLFKLKLEYLIRIIISRSYTKIKNFQKKLNFLKEFSKSNFIN